MSGRLADETPISCVMTASGVIAGPQPARPRAHREVGVLAVHEEARVEPAELPPEVAAREQQAAGDDADLAYGVALPAAERLGVEDARALERDVESIVAKQTRLQSDGCAQHEPGLTVPSGIERPAAVEPVLGVRARERDDAVERALVHDRVRVEQQHELARAPPRRRG